MHTVTITAKFRTGCTMDDPERAKAWVRKLLLEDLEKSRLAAEDDDKGNTALFAVEILDVIAEPL